MATLEPRPNKDGILTAYRVRVAVGTDRLGQPIRKSKTIKRPKGMTDRQFVKYAQQEAVAFEQEIDQGYQTNDRRTFSEYANYVIDLKERNELIKHSTVNLYRSLMQRIEPAIGHIRVTDLRPQHLNDFYRQLQQGGIRIDTGKAVAKVDLGRLLKRRNMTRTALAEAAQVSPTTVTAACRGEKIHSSKAQQITAVLGVNAGELFKFLSDTSPLAPKSILEYHRFIRAVLSQAEKEMIVTYNAAAKATPPKAKKHEADFFTVDELNAILDALETEPLKWRVLVHLFIVTGCRNGEVLGLRWSKVDWNKNQITIDTNLLYSPAREIYTDTTKTENTRVLPLTAETMVLLKQLRSDQLEQRFKLGDSWEGDDFLFTQANGRPMHPSSPRTWMENFAKRHNLSAIHPHAFRHSSSGLLLSQGVDIVTVSKRLGHTRTSTTTDIYSHLLQEANTHASEQIADVLLRNRKKA